MAGKFGTNIYDRETERKLDEYAKKTAQTECDCGWGCDECKCGEYECECVCERRKDKNE